MSREEEEKQQKYIWMGIAIGFMVLGGCLLVWAIYLLYRIHQIKNNGCGCPISNKDVTEARKAADVLKKYSNKLTEASKTAKYIAPVNVVIPDCPDDGSAYNLLPTACGEMNAACPPIPPALPGKTGFGGTKTTTPTVNAAGPKMINVLPKTAKLPAPGGNVGERSG